MEDWSTTILFHLTFDVLKLQVHQMVGGWLKSFQALLHCWKSRNIRGLDSGRVTERDNQEIQKLHDFGERLVSWNPTFRVTYPTKLLACHQIFFFLLSLYFLTCTLSCSMLLSYLIFARFSMHLCNHNYLKLCIIKNKKLLMLIKLRRNKSNKIPLDYVLTYN